MQPLSIAYRRSQSEVRGEAAKGIDRDHGRMLSPRIVSRSPSQSIVPRGSPTPARVLRRSSVRGPSIASGFVRKPVAVGISSIGPSSMTLVRIICRLRGNYPYRRMEHRG